MGRRISRIARCSRRQDLPCHRLEDDSFYFQIAESSNQRGGNSSVEAGGYSLSISPQYSHNWSGWANQATAIDRCRGGGWRIRWHGYRVISQTRGGAPDYH